MAGGAVGLVAGAVAGFEVVYVVESPEATIDGRVIQGDYPAALERFHAISESGKLLLRKSVVIGDIGHSVWRIEENEVVLVVIVFEQSLVVELLDDDGVEPGVEAADPFDKGFGANERTAGGVADDGEAGSRSCE